MKTSLPVYHIKDYHQTSPEQDFYVNRFIPHIKYHHFATTPHKHNFYLTVLFTKGSGTHEIDFNTYAIKPGSVFMMSPGQMHNWVPSNDADGFVFFHSKDFYDKLFTTNSIDDFPFFQTMNALPVIYLKKKETEKLIVLFTNLLLEHASTQLLKTQKLHCIISLIYIELTRNYVTGAEIKNETYLQKIKTLNDLIDVHFRTTKYASEYALLMNLSEKHLNRMCKECIDKTTTQLIADRIILEARRMMLHSKHSISQIADELGYDDASYFSRFFKKHTKQSPKQFLNSYKK